MSVVECRLFAVRCLLICSLMLCVAVVWWLSIAVCRWVLLPVLCVVCWRRVVLLIEFVVACCLVFVVGMLLCCRCVSLAVLC